jgi:hypothetical protein
MKKIITILVLTALLITTFTGCGNSKNTSVPTLPNIQNTTQTTAPNAQNNTSDDNISTTEKPAQTTEYDPFAEAEEPETFPGWGGGIQWEEGQEKVLDYAPVISFQKELHCDNGRQNFGVMLFVNGINQPLKLDNSEEKMMHIVELENESVIQTMTFSPVVGEKGDKIYLQTVTMYDPNFVPASSNPDYKFSHDIRGIPASIDVTETTEKTTPPICTDYVKEPVTDEIRAEFQNQWKADNYLDTQNYVKTLKNGVLNTPADYINGEIPQTPFESTDSVEVALYGGGEPCMYRVSMYINHELVKGAFDGMDYIDMEMSKNNISRKKVDYKNSGINLNEYNFIYFVAVPFYDNYPMEEKWVLKSDSVTLMGEN